MQRKEYLYFATQHQSPADLPPDISTSLSERIGGRSTRSYRRWLTNKSQGKKLTKRMGRNKTIESVRQIVIRIAKETGWG